MSRFQSPLSGQICLNMNGEQIKRSLNYVSIPFIGSNLFKYWYNVVIKGEKQQFQSPLSGQICLNINNNS